MRVLGNRKGSALLWCILLIIILTILLGSVLTATYAYYNYTMRTVKRQQAYFTARSAVSMLLEELTSEEQVATNGEYLESSISVLPSRKGADHAVTVSDFGFGEKMGTAEATLVRNDDDEINIEVTAYYPDNVNGEKYVMKATVCRQPLYFGGIAVKHLSLNGKLTLGENTDLYWNNTDIFNTAGNGSSFKNNGGTITVNGNLVTKGDATITAGNVVAGRNFYGTATFSGDSLHSKKIWSPTEYIISNKTLRVDDAENTEYTTNVINTLKNITNYTIKYCNSRGTSAFGPNPVLADILGIDVGQLMSGIPIIGNIVTDTNDQFMKISDSNNSALSIRYIKLLSTYKAISDALDNAPLILQPMINIIRALPTTQAAASLMRDCYDAPWIEFSSSDEGNRSDEVVPLTYLFVDSKLGVRVQYGRDPGKASFIGQITDNISNNVGSFINSVFDIRNKPSYLVAYMEPNSFIELGYGCGKGHKNPVTGVTENNSRNRGTPQNLVFLYSLYGGDNTTVILHDGVTVVGEIICDNLIVEGDAKIIYSSINGGQIAKQKIAEYWAVSNFSD